MTSILLVCSASLLFALEFCMIVPSKNLECSGGRETQIHQEQKFYSNWAQNLLILNFIGFKFKVIKNKNSHFQHYNLSINVVKWLKFSPKHICSNLHDFVVKLQKRKLLFPISDIAL